MLPDIICKQLEMIPVVTAVISGISALAGVFLSQIFQYWSETNRHKRDVSMKHVESHIRKQENIQALQLQALKDISAIYQKVIPNIWSSPDFEEEDAYRHILQSMRGLMEQLNDYLKNYGFIIPSLVEKSISDILYKCNQAHWRASTSEGPEYEPSKQEIELTKDAIQTLTRAISDFKMHLGVIVEADQAY